MATTRLMPLHVGKGRDVSTAIADIIDYVKNPQKTDFWKFIYGYECDTRTADTEFLLSKRQYANLTGRDRGADDVIAYHLRQAFKPGEVTPEEANQIGRELALKLTKGNHAFVVCTHVDKHHVHNHIIINSTTQDCQKKFRNFWGSTWAVRRMNDKLCLEHGLSIVENPKPSREHYSTWMGSQKQPSHQEQLRWAIDAALEEKPKDFEELLKKLEAAKKHFDGLGITKLPSVKSLREEYAGLLEQKRKAYSSYKQARTDMKELHNVRANVEHLLNIPTGRELQRKSQKSRQ
ncbi:relaxase/mobilization nuclease domain-containing protein [Enterocloster clostridioformis]|nr:relaxase/mobilization nuclease domain-containing protein [Enterocloster clostridioformis]